MATFSAQGTLPASGAEIVAEPLADTFTHIINTLNGNNLDENNVDYTSSDGIATLQNAQTFSAAKTFSADVTLSGGDGALTFGAAGSVKIPDNEATSLVIEEADNAYLTFVTTNSGEKIVSSQAIEVGVDGTGHDVKLFGDTSGQYMLWDQSADELVLAGDTKLSFHDAAGGENIIASSDGHLEVNAGTTLDITAPTVDLNSATEFNIDTAAYDLNASGAVTIDSAGVSIDSSSASNLTTSSGALTLTSAAAATWSTSAGALTISGKTGVNIQEDGTDVIAIDNSRAVALTLGSDATGDIIYRNASGKLARLAVGSDGEVLKLASGLPSWASDSSGVIDSIANGSDNRIVTFSDSDSLNGEANLEFDGSTLSVSGSIDMVAHNNRIDLDADNDTSIRASADDTISIEVAGADDFTITANSFNVLTGSIIDLADNATVTFGDGDDATIKWDASNLEVSAGTAAVNVVAGDITLYNDNNDADVSLTMGTGSAESLVVEVLNGGSNKTAEEVRFTSKTASSTADHGKISFYVDEVEIGTFDDGGLDLASGKVFSINGTEVASGTIDSIANGADNRIVTFSDSDSLNGEANLTFNGSALQVTGTLTVGVDDTGHDVKFFGASTGKYILWDEAQDTLQFVDNTNLTFGTGNDADIFYDGTDLNISPAVGGAGDIVVNGASMEFDDSEGVTFGTGKDATIQYDGSDLVISPRAVGSGDVSVSGGGITVAGTSTLNSDVVVNDNSNNRLLLLDNDGTGTALEITQDAVAASTDYALHVHSTVAQTSGELVWIDHDHASSTSDVMRLRNDGTGHTTYITQNGVLASNKYGLSVYSDAAQTNEGLALFKLDNASSNKPVIEVIQDGAGPAIQVEQNTHSQPVILVESATASGGTAAAGAAFHSGYIESIGANSTATIWSGRNTQSGFMILCIYDGNSGANSTALIEFSTHSSAYEGTIMSQSGDDTIAVTTSDVTGTTGTSGQFTVSFRNGIIEVENRLHAVDNTRVGWWIFSH